MPGTYLGYPFDEEIFLMNWAAEVDPVLTALLDSGMMQSNATIASMIRNGSNTYTIPFYNVLTGKDDNYDGVTDITVSEPDGSYQTGVVYGRAHAWKDRDFINDFNSGANPMVQISRQVARYWHKRRQNRLIQILTAIFGITGTTREGEEPSTPVTPSTPSFGPSSDENYYHDGNWTSEWALHTLDITAASRAAATDSNMLSETSAAECMQKACGDSQGIFSMAIMHSAVALGLNKKQLLEFRKYTDPSGIQRTINIADWNGLTVIVDDGVPSAGGKYTTYLAGTGALSYASAPVKVPVETSRVVLEQGGYDLLTTRFRETIHPNGFSYKLPENCISPTDDQLATTANWKVVANPKVIPLARIVSNG